MGGPDTINFTRGVPANESFPISEVIDAVTAALRERGAEVLQYGPAAGFGPLREWLAEWMGVQPDQVLASNGSLQLIEFLCLHLVKPGSVVFTESPTYDRTLTMLHRYGATIVGIPLAADGPDIDALEAALRRQRPAFMYVIPDFQNPAGATCSRSKRERLVALAAQYEFLLVEDAPYRLLRYRGAAEPTLLSLAPTRVVHMGSFTKLIGPGVRTGYLVGPPALVAPLTKLAEDTYISPGYLGQATTWGWCRRGLLDPQIARLKALYGPRLEACLTAIDRRMPEATTTRPDGGFFLSVTLPDGVTNAAVRQAAAELGLNLADGRAFFPDGGGERFLRLPFCALTAEQIDEGVRRLAEAVERVRR